MSDTKKKLGLKPKSRGVDEQTQETYEHEEHQNNDVDEHVDEHVDDKHDNEHDNEHNDNEEEEQETGVLLQGRVKWFNDRHGYGYITCISKGSYNEKDIFIHHTNITPKLSNYKTLYPNEYVEFLLGEADKCFDEDENPVDTEYENQATRVTGIMGGPLLCDGSFRPNRRGRDFRGGSNRAHNGSSSRHDDDEDDSNKRGYYNNNRRSNRRDEGEDDSNQRERGYHGNNRMSNRNDDNENGSNPRGYHGNNRRPNRRNEEDENWQSVNNRARPSHRN
jgi:cold shock CspA family protein